MENKNCENCKYFVVHYIKKKTLLRPIGGQCIYSDVKGKRGRKMRMHDNCEKWECAEQSTERKKPILETLRD
ncbi:MAG: hypothetical protein K2N74_01515, partial [Clostridiales bacterium]|nr:hypothetical protein [Clostridiales bacterium]